MKHISIIGVWIVLIIIDGILLPSLTGLPSGPDTILFLSVMVVTFGIHRWVIGLGIVIAGFAELILGTYFGAFIGSWLIMAWGWYILNRFLNMKPVSKHDSFLALAPFTLFSLALFFLGEGILCAIIRFVYEPELNLSTLLYIIQSPVILIVVAIEIAVTLLAFRFMYSSRDSNYVA
mgnify:CR=1 FL=1